MVAKYGKGAFGQATKLHSKIVRMRGACENCGSTANLQCAHIISRKYSNTRTRLDNAFCLCAKCHYHFTYFPVEFAKFVSHTIGMAKYEELRELALSKQKINWEAEAQALEVIYEAMQADAA